MDSLKWTKDRGREYRSECGRFVLYSLHRTLAWWLRDTARPAVVTVPSVEEGKRIAEEWNREYPSVPPDDRVPILITT